MTEIPIQKTALPLFKLNQFILPIVILLLYLSIATEEITLIFAGISFIFALTNLSYSEYNLYKDKIVINKKYLFLPFKTTLFELPLKKLKLIEFEKGFYDKKVFIASRIALLIGLGGRGKTDNDHLVTIIYNDEFTTETHSETFHFDHRFDELEEIVKNTKPKK